MSDAWKILLIEDEPQMRRFLRTSLDASAHTLLETSTGAQGLSAAAEQKPDVVLLDLGLPDMDGLDVTRRLREWTRTPIIIISARHDEQEKVAVLDAGADDYVTKPFGLPELLARIRVARRHATMAAERGDAVVTAGDLKIDLGSRVVTRGGQEVRLTPVEYKLLAALARNAGRVMTYQQLLRQVWGAHDTRHKEYLHVYVGHLRGKLERQSARPEFLLTEAGVGYRLKA